MFNTEPVESVLELIGNTPMVRISRFPQLEGADIYAKVESFNPCGSIKDRISLSMIEQAERQGLIKHGDTIIEPTSGNTGIGLALTCAVKGYKLILTMPETMSIERRNMLKAFGAQLILTDGKADMPGAIVKSEELAQKHGYFQPQQFKNPANPEAHRGATAIEILELLSSVDAFVAGVGTGGTISGVGETLKEKFGSNVKIIAVEPEKSAVLSGGTANIHGIQGIGAGFVPDVLNRDVIDEIIKVSDEDAYETARRIIRYEGILCGISSGANFYAAQIVAKNLGAGKNVVTVFPDTGERYVSTSLFQ
ncbi:MAG: cysteine synthase A [Nitrospirae bacterium]|nr:cysteine synthase A [Nitrospirota bacterium]